ncbi:MAG: hypothetical protein H6748_17205 [Spirochaetaceae bacterium]|nr:hypothetical protein [Myxococcales bacterium]MCB9725789.1 hypothetical protein [Spirochaetaceae bacterium]HPG25772.1 hypothetical protein [Myxococcota bacterium]
MLTKFDDYPIHQTPEPLAVVATSDRHAYDRYWFNGYQDDGAFYFGIGAAVYPNLGIVDCGLSIVHDGEQHAFHGSRRAPAERSEIEVGPFRIEILEPMFSLRIRLDENETGISADLLWIPRTASFAEEFQRSKRTPTSGARHMEATRFNQFGRWKGWIRYGGRTVEIDPARVYGTKDRSWGIRPVGDPAPPGAPPTELPAINFLWFPLHWQERCTHAGIFENEHGVCWHWDGMIMPTYERREDIPGIEDPKMEPLAGVDHAIHEFFPGTRRARRAAVSLKHLDGRLTEIELESLLVFRMKGIGYSHPEWGHGKWKGELAIGGESWKIEDCANMELPNQHIQSVVRARLASPSGEQQGVGVMEQIHIGPSRRYGFKEFLDPAR